MYKRKNLPSPQRFRRKSQHKRNHCENDRRGEKGQSKTEGGGIMEYDFLDDLGEGAFYADQENANDNPDEHPTDELIKELEEIE